MRKLAALAFALSSLALFAERDMAIYRGKLTSDLNANGKRITSVGSPLNPGDAANKEYVDSHGGGCDTNAVDILANAAVVTNALTVATTNRVAALETATNNLSSSKADKAALPVTAGNLAALTADGGIKDSGMNPGNFVRPEELDEYLSLTGGVVNGVQIGVIASGSVSMDRVFSFGIPRIDLYEEYNLLERIAGIKWYYGESEDPTNEIAVKGDIADAISSTNPTFSSAVLAVNLDFTTNTTGAAYVAVTNALAGFGFDAEALAELPGGKVYGSIGALLAALAAAAAWLKKNKVGSFKSVGGATATVENGVAKLDDFFTESNSLLTGTIDAEVISKGTAPDAHLEAPTDEHLKLVLADNSVAYDSAKALPYKLTSVIGDRVVATMTLTAASTDITLPTISANDTTVKDFILDVTNAYAVEGVATDAGINIPRTDFKLVTRDGESLTDVTTVKAGKSAFICFTQKSPVVVDGTTYPCWCVIQLPFGDPS